MQEARKAAYIVTHTTQLGHISRSSVRINTHHITTATAVDIDKLVKTQM